MSSIDKGVESVVNSIDSRIRVIHVGNQIVGMLGNEKIFSLADRYGYLHDDEAQYVRRSIAAYRHAKREEERRRLEALESQRKNTYAKVRQALENKISQLRKNKNEQLLAYQKLREDFGDSQNLIKSIKASASIFKVDGLLEKKNQLSSQFKNQYDAIEKEYQKLEKNINAISTTFNASSSIESLNDALSNIYACKTHSSNNVSVTNEHLNFVNELKSIQKVLVEVGKTIKDLQELKSNNEEINIIVEETIKELKTYNISSIDDVLKASKVVESRLDKAKHSLLQQKNVEDLKNISRLEGAITACKKVNTFIETGSYVANSFREEIVNKANEVIDCYESLNLLNYKVWDSSEILGIKNRIKDILLNTLDDESTLKEVEVMQANYESIMQKYELSKNDYKEYLDYIEQLKDYYQTNKHEIPHFEVDNFNEQRNMFKQLIKEEKRREQMSNMFITSMHLRSIMQEMGFKLFANAKDNENYVIENLYVKEGYDGVMWQVVVLADGSFSRRLIGINNGESQTDINAVIDVAKEMDENEDGENFMKLCEKQFGSRPNVNKAIEHNSPNVKEEIKNNGYHYMNADAYRRYKEMVELKHVTNQSPKEIKKVQIVTAQKADIVAQTNLRRTLQQSMAISRHAD